MSWTEIRDDVLAACLDTFSEASAASPITYLPGTGGSISLRGVFSEQHVEVDPETAVAVTSQSPLLTIRRGDLPAAPVADADRVTVNGKAYRVKDVQEGSGGRVSLVLHLE